VAKKGLLPADSGDCTVYGCCWTPGGSTCVCDAASIDALVLRCRRQAEVDVRFSRSVGSPGNMHTDDGTSCCAGSLQSQQVLHPIACQSEWRTWCVTAPRLALTLCLPQKAAGEPLGSGLPHIHGWCLPARQVVGCWVVMVGGKGVQRPEPQSHAHHPATAWGAQSAVEGAASCSMETVTSEPVPCGVTLHATGGVAGIKPGVDAAVHVCNTCTLSGKACVSQVVPLHPPLLQGLASCPLFPCTATPQLAAAATPFSVRLPSRRGIVCSWRVWQ
jgi:hypothetical protein